MKRPIGITIIAVLAIVAGLVYLLAAVPFFGIGGFLASITGSGAASLAGGLGLGIGVVSMILGVLYLVLGFGAMSLKSWAWTLGVVVTALAAVSSIVSMMFTGLVVGSVVTALLSVGILVYLYTTDVRTAFGHEPHAGSSSHTPSMTA